MFLGLFTLDELVNGTEYPVLSPHKHSLDCWWDSYSFWMTQRTPKVWWEGGQWGPNPITSSRIRKWISTASEANSSMEQIDVVTGPMCCWLVARGGKLKLTMMWSWSWISQEITCEMTCESTACYSTHEREHGLFGWEGNKKVTFSRLGWLKQLSEEDK